MLITSADLRAHSRLTESESAFYKVSRQCTVNLKSTKILDIGYKILIRGKATLKSLEELKCKYPHPTADTWNQIFQGLGNQV